MYQRIKKLADDAIALQNKNTMDAALREIAQLCDKPTQEVAPVTKPDAMSIAYKIKGKQ